MARQRTTASHTFNIQQTLLHRQIYKTLPCKYNYPTEALSKKCRSSHISFSTHSALDLLSWSCLARRLHCTIGVCGRECRKQTIVQMYTTQSKRNQCVNSPLLLRDLWTTRQCALTSTDCRGGQSATAICTRPRQKIV